MSSCHTKLRESETSVKQAAVRTIEDPPYTTCFITTVTQTPGGRI